MFTFLKRFFGPRNAEPVDGELLIEEFWQPDFRKPARARFVEETGESYSARIGHDGLTLGFTRKQVYAWTVDPLYRYRDFVIESLVEFPGPNAADASPDRAGTMAAGFLFRYLSDSTFYSVLISDGGLIRMDAVVNGTPIPVLGWTGTVRGEVGEAEDTAGAELAEKAPYDAKSGVYSLRIIARSTSFTLVVNDIWVADCVDDTIQAGGKIAFAGQNWNARDVSSAVLSAFAVDSRPIEVETVYTRWNQYLPVPAEAHINLARTWYAMGKYVPAILELKRAWKNREPGMEELLLSGQVYLAQRLLPEAETAVRKALAITPSHEEASAELGGILYLQNRFVELDDLLSALSRETVRRSAFLSNLEGHLYHWKEKPEQAAEAYRRAAELNPDQGLFALHEGREWAAAGKTAAAVGAWLAAGKAFLAREEYDNLESVLPLLRESAAGDIRVLALEGKFRYATGDSAGAFEPLKEAVDGNTDDSAVWYLYGMILAERGATDGAIAAYRRALELEPEYGPYHFRLAETLYFAGEDCAEELARALETAGGNGWVFNLAALATLSKGSLDEADGFIAEARRLLPDEIPVLVNFAEIRRRQGRLDEALALLDTDDPEALRAGANLLVESGRNEEAEEWYIKALRRRPFDAGLLTDRAANCLELDLLNEADDLLGRALDREPSPRIYQLISYLAGRKGEHARAEVALQQGLAEYPENPDLLFELSALYLGTNRSAKAAATLGRLKALEDSERTRELELEIAEGSVNKIGCAACGRAWRVPKDIPAQGSLHLRAQPPDELPAGTCPSCGRHYCIGCARETLGEDGRFRCRSCGANLKLIDQNVIWLLNRWQAEQAD